VVTEYISKEEYIDEIIKKANDYEQTVIALLAFANHARWNESLQNYISRSYFSFGRRMDPEKGESVTPDLIVQKTEHYGIIIEAKKGFPQDKKYWSKDLDQLKSYDGKLKGWFTEDQFIKISDIVLLTHYTKGPAISKFIEERFQEGELSFRNNFSIVTFVISEEVAQFIDLEKRFGKIYDKYLDDSLKNIRAIPIEKLLLAERRGIKFYDSEPPMPYLLQILWISVFNHMKEDHTYDYERRCTPIPIEIQGLTETLQKYFGFESVRERDPEIPKKKWVKKALNILVESKHAEVNDKYPSEYIILYKPKRGDILDNFAKICYYIEHKRFRIKRKDKKQLELPI